MNAMQFDELMFRLVITEDRVASEAIGILRQMSREDTSLQPFLKASQQRQPNGQIVNVSLEERLDNMRKVYSEAAPIERGAIRLSAMEQGLRGRLIDALLNLEMSAPGDIRDALATSQKVQQNSHPMVLTEAIDFLNDAGLAAEQVNALRDEVLALYPPDPDDEEQPNAVDATFDSAPETPVL